MTCEGMSECASPERTIHIEVNFGLPNGNAQVSDGHDVNTVKSRLVILIHKLEADGTYTRANTAALALETIEKLQQAHGALR